MRENIIRILKEVFELFKWNKEKESSEEYLVKDIFRNLHGHSMLMKFLYKHKENILMKVQYKKNDILSNQLSNCWGISYAEYMSIEDTTDFLGKISKTVYKIIRAFCFGVEKNKHLIWYWREYLLFVDNLDPETKINVFYEIIRSNRKVNEWVNCSKYIVNICEQIEKSEIRENVFFTQLMVKVMAIFLEILKCDKLFAQTEIQNKIINITINNRENQYISKTNAEAMLDKIKKKNGGKRNDEVKKAERAFEIENYKFINLQQLVRIEYIVKYSYDNDTLIMEKEERRTINMDETKTLVQSVRKFLENNANEDYFRYMFIRLTKGIFFIFNKRYNHYTCKRIRTNRKLRKFEKCT